MFNFKCYYDKTFVGTVLIYGKAQWDKKYVEKRIYYNEKLDAFFTRYDGEILALHEVSNEFNKKPFYELSYHVRHFSKGSIVKRGKENNYEDGEN